jgi:excisionase family DNA binding protein
MTKMLLTVNEAAEILTIGRTKLYELIGRGALPTVRLDGSVRISSQALLDFIGQKSGARDSHVAASESPPVAEVLADLRTLQAAVARNPNGVAHTHVVGQLRTAWMELAMHPEAAVILSVMRSELDASEKVLIAFENFVAEIEGATESAGMKGRDGHGDPVQLSRDATTLHDGGEHQ